MATRKEGYLHARSYEELQNRHCFLFVSEPWYENNYGFLPHINSYISVHTIRFPIDYKNIKKKLIEYFNKLVFSEVENEAKSKFEVQIGFNAVLHKKETNEFSLFFGLDFKERYTSFVNISHRASFTEDSYRVENIQDVKKLPTSFKNNLPEIISKLSLYFESSGVRVIDIINVVYLIKQFIE